MDTSKLKKFAVEARKSLMGTVGAKLKLVLAENSFERRNNPKAIKALEGLIKEIGEEQTIEKVAYIWFNRFIALRFMDVNHYTKIGVVSPVEGQTQPEVLSEAKSGYIDTTIVSDESKQRILGLLDGAISSPKPQEEVYRLLLVSYCNAWNKQLPFMFGRIKDYTELLMPDDLLSESSVLTQTVETLDAETCKDVEVIGWLYQYFNQEEKDRVIKAKKRYKGFEIPYATQLFTPDWIVRYMTQNSLGKLWMEANPTSSLKNSMEFYLEPRNVPEEAKKELSTHIFKGIKPQEIKVFDPACGSGHVLVYAFDILFEIYQLEGYQPNEIPEMILKNNLFGLDICDRAAQLAQFAVMMKARAYDRNIFNKVSEVNICSVKDTKWIKADVLEDLLEGVANKEYAKKQIFLTCECFNEARIIGSLCKVEGIDISFWEERLEYFKNKQQTTFNTPMIRGRLPFLIKQLRIMQQNYECVITNPPYMGGKYMEPLLAEFIQEEYKDVKSDLFSAFIVYCQNKTMCDGYLGFMTPFVWMFISSYEDLRNKIINDTDITSLVQLEYSGFDGATVPICTFTLAKRNIADLSGCYIRLSDFPGAKNQPIKTREAVLNKDCGFYYETKNTDFHSIPGSPIAYWASDRVREIFSEAQYLGNQAKFANGLNTGDNNRFLRVWNEVSNNNIKFDATNILSASSAKEKWFPYNKGGDYRKWYGNNDYVVNWKNDGFEMKEYAVERNGGKHWSRYLCSLDYMFKDSITYSFISSANFGVRNSFSGFLFDVAGSSIFPFEKKDKLYIEGLLNSKIAFAILRYLNPTLNFQTGNVAKVPLIFDYNKKTQIDALVEQNIAISKDDWDSFETSWDFEEHPLIRFKTDGKVANSFNAWAEYKEQQFNQLKANEEELNRLFIEIYGLQDEMTSDIADKDITVAKADEVRDIKSLISYAVGCMFGRYSLDTKGLVYAGGDFNESKYKTFKADIDNAIPVLSDNYFVDDVVERFYNFIKVAFGEEHFDENISYIVNVLGKKNSQTAEQVLRDYFVKDFYKDHVQMYQKRPIYWMFSSEKNGFNALVYLHRYNKDTVNIVLNEYLREYQNKLSAKISSCSFMETKADASQSDKIKAGKERQALQIMLNEVEEYERNTLYPLATERKEIDLDDGVKVNYLKFGKALRNIGLKEKA